MALADQYYFELSEEEVMARDMARDFARGKVAPLAEKIDHEHWFPEELVRQMSELGMMGIFVPEELGGAGLTQLAYALMIEEISVACASTSVIMSAHNSLCLWPILEYGSDAQKEKFVKPLASGELLGCFALSEPGSGSDAAGMICTATPDGDGYLINGTKNWITNGPEADVCVLIAMQDKEKGHRGITAFVHSMKEEGISLGKKEDKLGICGSPTSSIMYDNVRLSKDHLLSEEGQGFKVAMNTLNGGRIGIAAQATGIARAALEDALRYANERKAFGKTIGQHQSIQNYLSEMATRIDASRLMTLSAARMKEKGQDYIRQAAQAKLFASETAMYCANKGIQIHGGYGYVKEYPAERHLRDAKITEIYEGTSEIQRLVIAGQLLADDI